MKARGRLYKIRGAFTKKKEKLVKGSHTPGGARGGGFWFEMLHCAWPRFSPNGMCYKEHAQLKVDARSA